MAGKVIFSVLQESHEGPIGEDWRYWIEAKVFNAAEGELLGPFPSADESYFEIFTVNAKRPAALTEDTVAEVRRLLQDEWLAARAREHNIELF